MVENLLSDELRSFQDIWKSGYYEGNPLDPLSSSTYQQIGYISVLHATYLKCIEPYIASDTVALEIGPGRGAWTKTMLQAKEVWAIDARSDKDNCFSEYLHNPENVKYIKINDFECKELPNDKFTYMFSFGCLCHVSFEGITEYAVNLYPKLIHGSNCFWMIADYDKYNNAMRSIDNLSIWTAVSPRSRKLALLKYMFGLFSKIERRRSLNQQCKLPDKDNLPSPGRWFHSGTERTCSMLTEAGYQIVSPDVGTILRDPIIHFRKI